MAAQSYLPSTSAYPSGPGAYPPPGAAAYPPAGAAGYPALGGPSAPAPAPPTAWQRYCDMAEVRSDTQADLYSVLSQDTTVVVLCDDSGSMSMPVKQPNGGPSISTRWMELMGDVQSIVQLVTAVNPRGVDIAFMNRPGARGICDISQVGPMFASGPGGGTPMIGLLNRMYREYADVPGRVLLILVTDGEPSDGEYADLKRTLLQMPPNFYISFVECNDNEEEMSYLESWDTQIPRFHNQEDYGEELNVVRRVNGPNTKFTRQNYVQMSVLSPIFPKYAIDIRSRDPRRMFRGTGGVGCSCTTM